MDLDRLERFGVKALIAEDRALRELVRALESALQESVVRAYGPECAWGGNLRPDLAALLSAVIDGRDE